MDEPLDVPLPLPILRDEGLPPVGPCGIKTTKWGSIEQLSRDMLQSFPRSTESLKKSKAWTWISNSNEEDDRRDGERGIGRMYTTNYGVTAALEQDPDRAWAAKMRARLDVRIAQTLAGLRLWDNVAQTKLYTMPKTGGRWLLTTTGCKRQELHTDFHFDGNDQTADKPAGYFIICSAEEAFLWVCEYSHKILAIARDEDVPRLAKGLTATKVRIPPNAIFVGRGDSFHAGVSHKDLNCEGINARYHVYVPLSDYSLPDGIHILAGFNPRFVDPDMDPEMEIAEREMQQKGVGTDAVVGRDLEPAGTETGKNQESKNLRRGARGEGKGKDKAESKNSGMQGVGESGGEDDGSDDDIEEMKVHRGSPSPSTSSASSSESPAPIKTRPTQGKKKVLTPSSRSRTVRRGIGARETTPDHISETPQSTQQDNDDDLTQNYDKHGEED